MIVEQEAAAQDSEQEGVVIELLDRFDEPAMFGGTEVNRDGETVVEGAQPVSIRVIGMNSKAYQKAEAWQRKQYAALGGRAPTEDQSAEIFAGFLARCCRSWAGFFTPDGAPIPFSTDNAADVLKKLPFVRRQVLSAIGNAKLFRPKTATN